MHPLPLSASAIAAACLLAVPCHAGQRLRVSGFAEPTASGGGMWLRQGPGRDIMFLVLADSWRTGAYRTGRVTWVLEPTGTWSADNIPIATLAGVLQRTDLWPSGFKLDAARFAGQDNGRYPSLDEPLPARILIEAGSTLPDADHDGVADASDAFPNDPNESLDTDRDGIGNNADADDDNDGIPDVYELAYHLNPRGNDATFDLDSDGRSNRAEYEAGTAADDPSSWFRVARAWLPAPGRLRLEWQALPGRTYSVSRMSTLTDPPRQVASDLAVDVPGTLTYDLSADSRAAFYFLQVRLNPTR